MVPCRLSGQPARVPPHGGRFRVGANEETDGPALVLPAGGPLALHREAAAVPGTTAPIAELADRMTVGRTRGGEVEVRLGVSPAGLGGLEIQLRSTPNGVEATLVAATEAARCAVEERLARLGRGLARRGVAVAKLEVVARTGGERGSTVRHEDDAR